ncbi:MAG: MarR family transcriptional regulator, partial [bacterium]|nr:MarR family transcriptional regulator [bacterium]
ITPVDWALIGLLYSSKSGLRLNQLAEDLGVESPFITERGQVLMDLGYVTIVPDKDDKRVKCMNLTPKGKQKVPTIEKDLIKRMKPLLKGASIKNIMGYRKTLEIIVANKPDKAN